MATFASIDIGTNTISLLIAEINEAGDFNNIQSENRITRLGAGFAQNNTLSGPAIERALATLIAMRALLEKEKIDRFVVTGTSAVRKAKNRKDFLESVKQKTGFEITVISGEEEARCTLLGISLLFQDRNKTTVVIDIGGGSTELIADDWAGPPFLSSTPLGAVTLSEGYLLSDPPTAREMKSLENVIAAELAKIEHPMPSACRFVGTAGTLTTLAAIDQKMTRYDPDRINGYRLSYSGIEGIVNELARLPIQKRQSVPGLEKGREDLIVSGGLILLSVMKRFGYHQVLVSDYGLREGLLIDLYQNSLKTTLRR